MFLVATRLILRIVEKYGRVHNKHERKKEADKHWSWWPQRGRGCYAECLGENDDNYRFCQWCAKPSATRVQISKRDALHIDEEQIAKRYKEFKEETAGTVSMKSRCATTQLYTRILTSRAAGRSVKMGESQPRDVVEYLCWLDSCGKRRRTVVHARDCTAVGTTSLEECSTEKGTCMKRYAHDSLRTNHVSKLAVAFEKEMGCTHDWDSQRRTGNPVRSELVAQYMLFTTRQQKRAGVLVKQASAILRSHLHQMIVPMRVDIDSTTSKMKKVVLARDVAFFMVTFNTTKRGEELVSTLTQSHSEIAKQERFDV